MLDDTEYEPVVDEPARYTLGKSVADEIEATAVIEIFRHKNDEKVCVAAVIMVEGTVACPIVEDWKFDGPGERQLFQETMILATGKMADFYTNLPEELRTRLEEDQGADNAEEV
ncbi:MAG: hypothetical protein GY814_04090 [Gammaproteobacteria bacterium]|nr:hypothetical protein [Gammaproteobacteria bacterium]